MNTSEILIIGANGQLGLELQKRYPDAKAFGSIDLDITDRAAMLAHDWDGISVIINAAGYTDVDMAETADGRIRAWKVNGEGVRNLADISMRQNIVLVHVSSDYVFDGRLSEHFEDEQFSPLSVYGQTKAAGDTIVSLLPKHYILRPTWVVGEGKNFVRTMLNLGRRGIEPAVVNDQIGRLTFTRELVRIINHLITVQAPYGTYNATNDGEPASWADITRLIFELGKFNLNVTDVSTSDYYMGKDGAAHRPLNSVMNLTKLKATGFEPHDWREDLEQYITEELTK